MKCPFESIECVAYNTATLKMEIACVDCPHYARHIRPSNILPKTGRTICLSIGAMLALVSLFTIIAEWHEQTLKALLIIIGAAITCVVSAFWCVDIIFNRHGQ